MEGYSTLYFSPLLCSVVPQADGPQASKSPLPRGLTQSYHLQQFVRLAILASAIWRVQPGVGTMQVETSESRSVYVTERNSQ